MQQALRVAIPAVSFGLMMLVGLDLTPRDIRAALGRRRALLAGLVAPWILVPLLVLGVVHLLHPAPDIEAALLLLAACPTGGMANFHTYLARANTALAVTMTTFSCVAAIVTLPALLWVYSRFSTSMTVLTLPPLVVATHVFGLLILPVLAGMAVRGRWSAAVQRSERALRGVGAIALLALLGLAVAPNPRAFVQGFVASGPLVLFTLASGSAGLALARLLKLPAVDGFALTMQLPVRNLAIAAVIAVNLLNRPAYSAHASAFLIVQTSMILAGVALFRWRGRRAED